MSEVTSSESESVEYFKSDRVQLLMRLTCVMEGVRTLGEFLDPRTTTRVYRSVVDQLEAHTAREGVGKLLDDSNIGAAGLSDHQLDRCWAYACGELGEMARMRADYAEAVRMYRKSMRVWEGFAPETRVELAGVLAYVAALAGDVSICLDALAVHDALSPDDQPSGVVIAAHRLASLNFGATASLDPPDIILARLRT